MKRLDSLDWLRGICALGVMVYHLGSWCLGPWSSNGPMPKIGMYGVSLFFALSGLSMAMVYAQIQLNAKDILAFAIRRIFRIWPLLWLCLFLLWYLRRAQNYTLDPTLLWWNLTTLFAFYKHDAYLNVGAWSIGNEIFFYSLSPFLIYFMAQSQKLCLALWSATLVLLFSFAFLVFDVNQPFESQALYYINPFNNLFFYVSGIALYFISHKTTLSKFHHSLLIIPLSIPLFYYPWAQTQIELCSGWHRIIWSFWSLGALYWFYHFPYHNTWKWISSPLAFFGVITYGVYLLHPLVHDYWNLYVLFPLGLMTPWNEFWSVLVITPIVAWISYLCYEKPMNQLGRRICNTWLSKKTKTS